MTDARRRQPHVFRGPYLLPERAPERIRWGDIIGLLAILGLAFVAFVVLPVSGGAP